MKRLRCLDIHLQIHFNLQLWPANRAIPDAISYCKYTVSYLSVCVSVCLYVYLERIVFQGWASLHVCLAATRRIISSNNSNSNSNNNGNKISKQKQQQQQKQQTAVANCNLIPEKCAIQRRLNEVLQVRVCPSVPLYLGPLVRLSSFCLSVCCQLAASLGPAHSRHLWLQTEAICNTIEFRCSFNRVISVISFFFLIKPTSARAFGNIEANLHTHINFIYIFSLIMQHTTRWSK